MHVRVVTSFAEIEVDLLNLDFADLPVADVWLAHGDMLSQLAQFRHKSPLIKCLAMSGDTDPSIPSKLRVAGAHGFIQKQSSPEQFIQAIETLLAGGEWFQCSNFDDAANYRSQHWEVTPAALGLTERQGEILTLLLRGLPNKRIACAMNIAESTVKEHVSGILDKLGVRNRVGAITLLNQRRIRLSAKK
jgi:DNA-binding NarL/FixJ family response regulator